MSIFIKPGARWPYHALKVLGGTPYAVAASPYNVPDVDSDVPHVAAQSVQL